MIVQKNLILKVRHPPSLEVIAHGTLMTAYDSRVSMHGHYDTVHPLTPSKKSDATHSIVVFSTLLSFENTQLWQLCMQSRSIALLPRFTAWRQSQIGKNC